MAYLIIPGEESSLQIDPQIFASLLIAKWSDVTFETASILRDPFVLRWIANIGGDVQLGALHHDHQTVSLDDDPKGIPKFAIWYRGIIPSQYKLFLYHDSSDASIELGVESTESAIQEALNAL